MLRRKRPYTFFFTMPIMHDEVLSQLSGSFDRQSHSRDGKRRENTNTNTMYQYEHCTGQLCGTCTYSTVPPNEWGLRVNNTASICIPYWLSSHCAPHSVDETTGTVLLRHPNQGLILYSIK